MLEPLRVQSFFKFSSLTPSTLQNTYNILYLCYFFITIYAVCQAFFVISKQSICLVYRRENVKIYLPLIDF